MSKVVPQPYRLFDFVPCEYDVYTKENVWFVKPNFKMKVVPRSK